jgi:trans-2,3-dihydro-3-hydroxyanthranilate isomerase
MRPGATWRVPSFTPAGAEVVGAGHNALGAWWWLATAGRIELDADGGAVLAQEIGDDVLPVQVMGRNGRPEAIVIEQAPPAFGRTVTDRDELARALGLDPGARDLFDHVPAQVVSTGAPHLLVAARDRGVVDRARPDATRLAAALAQVGGQGCYLYCLDPSIRPPSRPVLQPDGRHLGGSATGSAAGPLVSRLVAQGVVP